MKRTEDLVRSVCVEKITLSRGWLEQYAHCNKCAFSFLCPMPLADRRMPICPRCRVWHGYDIRDVYIGKDLEREDQLHNLLRLGDAIAKHFNKNARVEVVWDVHNACWFATLDDGAHRYAGVTRSNAVVNACEATMKERRTQREPTHNRTVDSARVGD